MKNRDTFTLYLKLDMQVKSTNSPQNQISDTKKEDKTSKLLDSMDAISNVHLAPKKPVLETVTKLSRIQGLQESNGLNDIETLFLKKLYEENNKKNKRELRSRISFRLKELNTAIKARISGDKSVFIPVLDKVNKFIENQFPELNLSDANNSYAYANIFKDAWNSISNAVSSAASYVADQVSSYASSEAWSGVEDGFRDSINNTNSYRSSSSRSSSGSSSSSSNKSAYEKVSSAYNTAKSVLGDVSYGTGYVAGYAGGSALKSGAAALGNFFLVGTQINHYQKDQNHMLIVDLK